MVDLNNIRDSESAPLPVNCQSGILALLLTVSCPLLAIVFLFLVLKLLCHSVLKKGQRSRLPTETMNSSGNSTIQTNRPDCTDARRIQCICVELFKGEIGEDAQCSICLGDLVDGNEVKILPKCKHVFHPECIDMWLSTHSSCPLCRASLVSRSVVDPSMVV